MIPRVIRERSQRFTSKTWGGVGREHFVPQLGVLNTACSPCLRHLVTQAPQRIQYDAKAFLHRRLKGIHLALKRITSCANGTNCVLGKMPSSGTEGGMRS